MQNENGETVELYIPRKCSATNRIINANDHASIQICFAKLDDQGKMIPNQVEVFGICGAIRRMGESDDCLNRLTRERHLLPEDFEKKP
ncbi:hypothetical protein SNEBB_006765 [Seison nebaliae]|nr:hypothetical protein SNEBB_006765 [Seison nebaliae]